MRLKGKRVVAVTFQKLQRNIKVRIYNDFLTKLCNFCFFPFVGMYLSEKLGQSLTGLLLFISVAFSILAIYISGVLTEQWGRKRVIILAQSINLFAYIGLLYGCLIDSAWLTFYMVICTSIGIGLFITASDVMLLDIAPEKEVRKFIFRLNYWLQSIAVALGFTIGGIFFGESRISLLIVLIVITLICLMMTILLIHETVSKRESSQKTTLGAHMKKVSMVWLKDYRFFFFCLGSLSIFVLGLQMQNYVSIRFQNDFAHTSFSILGWSIDLNAYELFSLIRVENMIIVVLGTFFISRFLKRVSEFSSLNIGIIFTLIGICLLGVTTNAFFLILGAMIYSIGSIIFTPTRQSVLADLVDEESKGSYMAVNNIVFQVSKMIGALYITLGSYLSSLGMSIIFILNALLGMGLFFLAFGGRKQTLQPKKG
ncbi:MFS transporter, DHA1 family, multidrug resistance protein B [Thermoactinomyces sp. DSM 45891]|uniref:MFS transporter n=1 Tax=Thermoactinomyces sp. DSM 45891 TaxID=1761907 RepID=UPI00090F46E9|nr:MFS transporter [Thermoactinomyces sp. DSM 45891]SFX71669.1 MFS transporter, DHA1 family, multidrug resistance protein B [Thermoactinomyces sp. DSM 45891]